MKVSAKQLLFVFVAFIVTFGILRGIEWLYVTSALRTPLIQSVERLPGVIGVQLLPSDTVMVRMKPQADLMTVYQTVDAEVTAVYGRAPASIAFVDNPDATLNQLAGQIRFVVAQGEATGQYVAMETQIAKLAADHHVVAHTELGYSNLFLTLKSAHHVLYQIIPLNLGGGVHG